MENKPYTNFLNAMKSEGVTFSQIADLLECRYQTVSDTANGVTKKVFILMMPAKSKECYSRNMMSSICLKEHKTNICSI